MLIFRLATENCYMIFLILTITSFSLCSLLKMLYNREYCPTFRQMDKAGERTIKKTHKPLNYFLCEMILLVSNNSSLYILSFLQIHV